MIKRLNKHFWSGIARIIIRGRFWVLFAVVVSTLLISTQWKYNRIIFKERSLLPDSHPVNIEYQNFLETFGEEGNTIVIAIEDSTLFSAKNFEAWNTLNRRIDAMSEFEATISTENLQIIKKDVKSKSFITENLWGEISDPYEFKDYLENKLPFYEGLIYNKNHTVVQSLLFMDKELVDTRVRSDFIVNDFLPIVKKFESDTGMRVHISGMPYIRTMNAETMLYETRLFVVLALSVTAFIFFLFFRSFRATLISMFIVGIAVMWGFGLLGFMHYEITALTALIPPLIIVIGLPNAIFLINKYQQEVNRHGHKARALVKTISKVGNATLMTNLTTAAGFATFIVTNNSLLGEFGIIASINIVVVFLLTILIVPAVYSILPAPKERHLRHLRKNWLNKIISGLERIVRHHRIKVYILSFVVLILGLVGMSKINLSGSVLDDIPKNRSFTEDIKFFEREFSGILPVEIIIDTKRRNASTNLSILRRLEMIGDAIGDIEELSPPLSVVNTAKYIKQSYYNGNPEYYDLSSAQERNFILDYMRDSKEFMGIIDQFTDATGEKLRLTTMMKSMDMEGMNSIKEELQLIVDREFPKEKFEVHITGKPLEFATGTTFLIQNLFTSLLLAVILIALLMAYLFRSFRMIVISLIPNILPLIITAGFMGFLGIPLKPSTVLIFSIAFGISVDDTLHFLAKYRQELKDNKWNVTKSVYLALQETGVSMIYTSVVLFFGFAVFITSSFGGTVALGGLVALTLFFAMLANLILLPGLLLSLKRTTGSVEES